MAGPSAGSCHVRLAELCDVYSHIVFCGVERDGNGGDGREAADDGCLSVH